MVPGWMQIALVVLLAVLLFGGRGKISSIMGDFAKGIKSFKKGMKDEDEVQRVERGDGDPIDVTPRKEKV
ncbi:twin-arginine translocase TatA/TatE family subunit [Pikeienuella sp. HZG-20]|uniref:twin-arginine translocase TatA/TatE family subunit n=1 Tax=Paludibacillus litoralis TaxID=3133267 RepID=UPI0030EC194B